ncbi:cupin domain-containing protein [uncultured Friedmanniella sp.]|uniref:cupin domain-containing protein n=1 Tax=uncultured Friedmanniella sp. TaxID=335381 RepID=UPI0035C9BDEE
MPTEHPHPGSDPDHGDPGDRVYDRRLHQVAGPDLTEDTTQTTGMRRREAISGKTVGSSRIWMGETIVPPVTGSGNHHHGESETGIYVVQGHPEFVFLDGETETRLRTEPGDYVYVPPFVPHREENPDPAEQAVVVIARSTQEAIVVNLDDLVWVGPVAVGKASPDQRTWHDHEVEQQPR